MTLSQAVARFVLAISIASCRAPTAVPLSQTGGTCQNFARDVERFWPNKVRASPKLGGERAKRAAAKVSKLTRDWIATREAVCKDARARKITFETHAQMGMCLGTALYAQKTLVDVLLAEPTVNDLVKLNHVVVVVGEDVRACRTQSGYSRYKEAVKSSRGDDVTQKAVDDVQTALAEARVYDELGAKKRLASALARGLEAAPRAGAPRLLAALRVGEGKRLAIYESDLAGADREAQAAQVIAERAGDDFLVADVLHFRGSMNTLRGDFDEALKWLGKSLAIRERVLGKDHPDTASSCNNIGIVYANKGDYEQAEKWYRKALGMRERALGKNHPDTAASYNNLGGFYARKGDYDESLAWFRKALAIHERVLGVEHPSTASNYANIGSVYIGKQQYAQALKWLRKSLHATRRLFGDDHAKVAKGYNNIGSAYSGMGENDQALTWYKKALAIQERVHGKDHPDVAASYNNIGIAHREKGNYDEALTWYKKALATQARAFGNNHPATSKTCYNIGLLYVHKGDYNAALEWYQKALAIQVRVFGKGHAYTAQTRNAIDLLCKAGHKKSCAVLKTP